MVRIGAGGIIYQDGKVLLMRRINTASFDHMWSNPGGTFDPEQDKTIEDTVVRELREELGVEVKIEKFLGKYVDRQGDAVVGEYTGYLVTIVAGTPSIREKHKADLLGSFSPTELPEPLAPYTKLYITNLLESLR